MDVFRIKVTRNSFFLNFNIKLNVGFLVHVTYPDVTAEDFLFVQTDINYRKEWDNTAVALDVIESDVAKGSNSQVMYWEMLWPVSMMFI